MSLIKGNVDEEESLIEQIESEMRKIHTLMIKLSNNLWISDPIDPLEQSLVRNFCYSSILLNRGIGDEAYDNKDALESLKDTIEKELDFLTNHAEELMSTIDNNLKTKYSIEENMTDLNLMVEASKKKGSSNHNLNDITKNIKMRFKREKSDLKTIITSLFAENLDIQDLIARIIEMHLNEGCDKYLQLESGDNTLEQIETLCRTKLFEVNPHDSLQIRLTNLL